MFCIHCTDHAGEEDLVSEDRLSEDAKQSTDLSVTHRKKHQEHDGKQDGVRSQEQPMVVVNGNGVCCCTVFYTLGDRSRVYHFGI